MIDALRRGRALGVQITLSNGMYIDAMIVRGRIEDVDNPMQVKEHNCVVDYTMPMKHFGAIINMIIDRLAPIGEIDQKAE